MGMEGVYGYDYDTSDSDGDGGGSGDHRSGGMSDNEKYYRFRFKIPAPGDKDAIVKKTGPVTKRIMIVSAMPLVVHEHNLYEFKGSKDFSLLCIGSRNKVIFGNKHKCPFCSKDGANQYPYAIGFYTVIDMGQVEYAGREVRLHHESWTDNKGVVHPRAFQKKLLGAKAGSPDKPGVLANLRFQSEKRGGSLAYTVWDVTRTGSKAAAVGDQWEFVESVEPTYPAVMKYLTSMGAEDIQTPSPIHLLDAYPDYAPWEMDVLSGKEPADPEEIDAIKASRSCGGVLDIDGDLILSKMNRLLGSGDGDREPQQQQADTGRGLSKVTGAEFGNRPAMNKKF